MGFAGRMSAPLVGICFMFLFIMTTMRYILRVDRVLGVLYMFVYIYTVFTQIAYVFFPDKLSIISSGQYYGEQWFWPFYAFVFASFSGVFLLFAISRSVPQTGCYFRLADPGTRARVGRVAFVVLILIHNLIMIYYTVSHFSSLSYHSQRVLKDNKIFFAGFAFYEYTVYASYVNWKEYSTPGLGRSVAAAILTISTLVFLTICVRAGQRIEIAALCVGLIVYAFGEKNARNSWWTYVGVALAGIIAFVFMNAIRSERGNQTDFRSLVQLLFAEPGKYASLTFEDIVFQDYCVPSLTLMTSMYYDRIDPIGTVKSLIANSLVLLNVPSLGTRVSRFIDPYGARGYGYYAFTEGFEVMGWAGFVYNSLIMNLGLQLWRPLLRTGNKSFTRYMTGIMVMSVFGLARGTSSAYVKAFYMWFVPCIVLFCLMSGTRPRLRPPHHQLRT
jgi:hypothetical protein